MAKITQRPIVCPSCSGSGVIPEPLLSTSTTRMCPACNGSGVVTETITESDTVFGTFTDEPLK